MARKYPGCAEQAQREIYRWMREGLSAGKHVVRLKIGDPFIFGRGGEEVLEMRELGVEPKVVPGISSVFSAPLLGSVPVTHRGVATQVGTRFPSLWSDVYCLQGEGGGGHPSLLPFQTDGRKWVVVMFPKAVHAKGGRKAQTPKYFFVSFVCMYDMNDILRIPPTTPFLIDRVMCRVKKRCICRTHLFLFFDVLEGQDKCFRKIFSKLRERRPELYPPTAIGMNNDEQVTLGTGYGQDYSRPDICDYHPQKTAVFLMAIGRLEELCADLVRRSYPVDTPVAIIENASTPRQRLVVVEGAMQQHGGPGMSTRGGGAFLFRWWC